MTNLHHYQWVALILMIIGAIDLGLMGLFDYDLIGTIFQHIAILGNVVYVLIGLAGLYGIRLLFVLKHK